MTRAGTPLAACGEKGKRGMERHLPRRGGARWKSGRRGRLLQAALAANEGSPASSGAGTAAEVVLLHAAAQAAALTAVRAVSERQHELRGIRYTGHEDYRHGPTKRSSDPALAAPLWVSHASAVGAASMAAVKERGQQAPHGPADHCAARRQRACARASRWPWNAEPCGAFSQGREYSAHFFGYRRCIKRQGHSAHGQRSS